MRIDELGVRASFTEAALPVLARRGGGPGRADHHPRQNAGFDHPRNANWPMFSPIANFRFGETAGYTGSRGTGEVRPRSKPCCHRLQSAESRHR